MTYYNQSFLCTGYRGNPSNHLHPVLSVTFTPTEHIMT